MTFSGAPTQQRADFVSGQASPRSVFLDCDGESIGIGVIRDDEVDSGRVGRRIGEVERPWLFGVRERDRRECAVRVNLFGDDDRIAQSSREIGAVRYVPADSVQRRVDERNGIGWPSRHRRRLGDVLLDKGFGCEPVLVRFRKLGFVHCRGGANERLDLGVGGGNDLRTLIRTAEVDLVSVVARWVVARGHHHAGTEPQ